MTYPAFLHPDVEALAEADLARLQAELWSVQWDYVRAQSEFYRQKLGSQAVKQLSLAALADLTLTDKEELRQAQELDYPYGTYLACSRDRVVRIHRTSGTTGRALILANTRQDVDVITEQGARSMYCAGLRPSDRVIHCLNYQLWTGGVTDHMTLERAGAATIPFGTGNTSLLVRTILDLKVTAISCTPSYPALLEKVLREEFDLDPRRLNLRIALFGGEAGLDNRSFRDRLESVWGFAVRNANFGVSEILSNMGSQCEQTTDLHFHSGDALFAEILDPTSGQRLPIRAGVSGEFVLTHLKKECQPLIRYRTRDVVTITGTGPCTCGRTGWRFRISGRTDDMFNVRGINVFPTAIQKVIADSPELSSGQFRIVLEGPGPYDRIALKVEAGQNLDPGRWREAAARLERDLRGTIGAAAEVKIVPFESLPRTEGKTALIERR